MTGQSLWLLVTSVSKSAYRFFFLLSFLFPFFSVVWLDAGQEVTLLHGILGVIVLQRPWVWNLSSLMHQFSLVNLLPKHKKKMAVF